LDGRVTDLKSQSIFDRPAAQDPSKACFWSKFSKNSLFLRWRPVSQDCFRHHPVLPNHESLGRLRIGRFCGDFCRYRCARSVSGDPLRSLGPTLASRLCIQKFRSPRQGFDGQRRSATWEWKPFEAESSVPSPGLQLLRFQPEGFELLAPFCRGITKSLDSDTTRQPTFDRSPDEIRCEERERDRHVDLTHAALLT
jgi:hypothetical protein